jgi:ADP-ribose pyrophosphatase YjhB (NUDIX family)
MKKEFYFAQKAFITRNGKLLLIKKSGSDPNQPNKWEVPGGRMKFGEDPDDQIKREVLEEVGLEVEAGEPFYVWQWQIEREDKLGEAVQMQIVAVARICVPKSMLISFEKHEEDDFIAEYAWVDFDQIGRYDIIQNMKPVVDKFLKNFM